MLFLYNSTSCDTIIDTKKIIVPINFKFIVRNYINKEGKSPLYLSLTSSGIRKRVYLNIEINLNKWDPKTQRVISKTQEEEDVNLILENIQIANPFFN